MNDREMLTASDLAALAKRCRKEAKKSRLDAARELGVTKAAIVLAENNPKESLLKLRMRIIERYLKCRVVGPFYRIERK